MDDNQFKEDKAILTNQITKLVVEFISKYNVGIYVSSCLRSSELKRDDGTIESTVAKVETNIDCYI